MGVAGNAGLDWRWARAVAGFAVLLTLIPFLVGFSMSRGRQFMWLGYNLDDSCVYLSWMRQAADGALLTRNLFTTDQQHGMAPNPLFWLLGRIAAIGHIPLIGVYHFARLFFGFALLLIVWELICSLIRDRRSRQLAFLFVCFSSGLGWLPLWWDGPLPAPIDMWQPEAITFLSLYLSPLFCFSMCLQAGMVYLLLMGARTGRMRFAIFAGLCGFVLGLTHTYDVATITAVWFVFLSARTLLLSSNRAPVRQIVTPWIQGIAAGFISLPAVAYIAYQLKTEAVFQARANVETLAPALHWVVLGYGITLILAIAGSLFAARSTLLKSKTVSEEPGWTMDRDAALLLILWAIVNVAVAYAPVTFQRKLMQGAHFPIALLAGIGAGWVWRKLEACSMHSRFAPFALLITGILCPTNVLFMIRDVNNFARNMAQTKLHRPYLQPGEIAALEWIKTNSPPGAAVQPLPWTGGLSTGTHVQLYTIDTALMCFTPGLIDRPVYCGHWGETPQFKEKLATLTAFPSRLVDDATRREQLRKMHVRFLIFSQKHAEDSSAEEGETLDNLLPIFRGRLPLPSYLFLRYSNPEADVYEVQM